MPQISTRLLGASAVVSAIALVVGLSIGPWGTSVVTAAPKAPAQPAPFQTILVFNQQAGTFPAYEAPANTRVIIRSASVGVLVPLGAAPVGSLFIAPLDPQNTGWLGSYQASFVFDEISNFQGVQDRFAANLQTNLILQPGQELSWFVTNAAGENQFASGLNAFLSISGELIPQ